MAAVTRLFPSAKLYLCNFHPEQAWERWVKERTHGLANGDAEILLDLLPEGPVDHYFQHELKQLKKSDIWLHNKQVLQWLTSTWLCGSEVFYIHIF